MPVATVSTLFRWFSLIPDEFWYESSCIRNIISLAFFTYVQRSKWNPNVIWASFLAWMWMGNNSNGHWWRQQCLLLMWKIVATCTDDVNNACCYYALSRWHQECLWLLTIVAMGQPMPVTSGKNVPSLQCIFVVVQVSHIWTCWKNCSMERSLPYKLIGEGSIKSWTPFSFALAYPILSRAHKHTSTEQSNTNITT
jgi:hypothetical protein